MMEMWSIALEKDVYDQWCHVRIAVGLHSDSQIAKLLIQQFKSGVPVSTPCVYCRRPLSLVCTWCNLPSQPDMSDNATPTRTEQMDSKADVLDKSQALNTDREVTPANSREVQCPGDTQKKQAKPETWAKGTAVQKCTNSALDHREADLKMDESIDDTGTEEDSLKISEIERPSGQISSGSISTRSIGTTYRFNQKTQTDDRPFLCNMCSASFKSRKFLSRHKQTMHDSHSSQPAKDVKRSQGPGKPKIVKPEDRRCHQCERVFTTKTGLKHHMIRAHMAQQDKPHVCSQCGFGFTTNSELKKHTRRHNGERKYVCDICAAAFVDQGGLTRHKKRHSADGRVFICEVCGAGFIDNCSLNDHMRIHSGERPYECAECKAKFRLISTLRKHERTHKGDRKYVCSVCGRAFVEREYWRSHMRIHTGERPFLCDICGAGFAQKGSLNSHRKTHNNVNLTDRVQV